MRSDIQIKAKNSKKNLTLYRGCFKVEKGYSVVFIMKLIW